MITDYTLLLERLAIVVLALVTFRQQYKQFAVPRDLRLKRQLLLISVGFCLYGLLTSVSVTFRIFSHPLAQGTSNLIGNLAGLTVFGTMVLFYLIYFEKK